MRRPIYLENDMPYATKAPTHEALLAAMKPGAIYTPYNLARVFAIPSAQAKVVLNEMAKLGKLSIIRPRKGLCFILPGTEHLRKQVKPKPEPEIDRATIALPRTYVMLTGQLVGYDAEIARRKQLCMMARGER
jgi:hypothetical protein